MPNIPLSVTPEEAALLVRLGQAAAAGIADQADWLPDPNLWTLQFRDDFTLDVAAGQFATARAASWFAYPQGWPDTSKRGRYEPANITVKGGVLTKRLLTAYGVPRVVAIVPRVGGSTRADGMPLGQLYGRYTVRARLPYAPGFKVAWLLWPDSEKWPAEGEIDFPEANLDQSIRIDAFVHRRGATVGNDQVGFTVVADPRQWHTYTIEWQPGTVRFFLDGAKMGETTDRVPNTPMHWVLQSETAIGGAAPAPDVVGVVEIDQAAVWSYKGKLPA